MFISVKSYVIRSTHTHTHIYAHARTHAHTMHKLRETLICVCFFWGGGGIQIRRKLFSKIFIYSFFLISLHTCDTFGVRQNPTHHYTTIHTIRIYHNHRSRKLYYFYKVARYYHFTWIANCKNGTCPHFINFWERQKT